MSENYFKCEPGTLCKDAACCRSPETKPALTVGDFIRLSELTGESPRQIWENKGHLWVKGVEYAAQPNYTTGLNYKSYTFSLSLKHDPCPYLIEMRCSVYNARPLACASFPFGAYVFNQETFRRVKQSGVYECLGNSEISSEQVEFVNHLCDIWKEGEKLDEEYFWSGLGLCSPTSRLDFIALGPFWIGEAEHRIAQKLSNLDCTAITAYHTTTEKLKALIRKIE